MLRSRSARHCRFGAVALVAAVVLAALPVAVSKLEPGAGCSDSKDHCDAPKSGLACCVGNTKCYSTESCASFIKTCPFTNDTKKSSALKDCLPDKSDFKKAKCPADVLEKVASTDGKGVPLKAEASCFESEKLTCQIYKNASKHTFISAQCKEGAKKGSSAHATASFWHFSLLALVLVVSLAVVLGKPW